MILRNLIFQLEVINQRLPAGWVSHHEQASKRNRELQHRVLWPAYNLNLATRQASTEGLFQQGRKLDSSCRVTQGFDSITESSKCSDHAQSACSLGLLAHSGAAFVIANTLMQNDPDQLTWTMRNRSDGFVVS